MTSPSPASGPIALPGFRFCPEGWRRTLRGRRLQRWSTIREIDLRLTGPGRSFRYRFEIRDQSGRAWTMRLRGGLPRFRALTTILRYARDSGATIRIGVFAADLLEVAAWDAPAFHAAQDLVAYDLELRARLYLLALEYEYALEDAQELADRFPWREKAARALRLKALLLMGDMRSAHSELEFCRDDAGQRDREAEAEYAIVALYRGQRDGERIARRLLDEGKFRAVELVGLEFSRYLSDRNRFKEALSVLRVSENQTRLVDADLFRTLLAARGEVLNKKDYRYYRRVGFLLRAEVKLGVFAALFLAALLWIVLPETEAWKGIAENAATRSQLTRAGERAALDPESLTVERPMVGLSRVRYVFEKPGPSAGRDGLAVGSTLMFANEARRILDHPESGYVLYSPQNPSVSMIAPVPRSRLFVDWYYTFDRERPLLIFLAASFIAGAVALARRLL